MDNIKGGGEVELDSDSVIQSANFGVEISELRFTTISAYWHK